MKVFTPDLPSPNYRAVCERDAVIFGRDLVLDDLAEHPDRETDYYVRAAVFHVYAAALYDSNRRDLLASLAVHPATSSLAALSPELFEDHWHSTIRRLSTTGIHSAMQCYWLMCVALGKPRGERARIAHIKAFLEYAREVPIEVPQLDWDSLTQGGTHGKS